jgi:eukaryotic-like serine/threonine-protein kinase
MSQSRVQPRVGVKLVGSTVRVAPDPFPAKVGPYRVEAELGRGMMGVVYRARDTRRGRRALVALKVIRMAYAVSEEQRGSFERRFLEEARIVSRLSHPGIVGIHDVGRDRKQDAPYIAFEYLEGRTLSALLDAGQRPDWREALRIVARVAEALHYAHAQGVVHRDVKPANVMVLPSGDPKIMDFGLAKAEAGLELTSTGQFMGTPLYMAPEQALGEPVDRRTDLFSLGSVAYTLLTGKRAFEAESVPQVLNRVAYRYPAPATRVAPALPADVDYLLGRALAKRRADRYPDGRTLAEDVEDVLDGRPPRHRGGWTMPALAEGTVVSAGSIVLPRAEPEPELELVEASARRRGRSAPRLMLALSAVAFGAVLYSSPFWRQQIEARLWPSPAAAPARPPSPAAAPARREASPPPASPHGSPWVEPSLWPGALDRPPAEPTAAEAQGPAEDPAPDAAAPGEDAPAPSLPPPAASPVAAPASPPPAARATPATSRLSITLQHGLKSGALRVLVDRKVVLEQKLTSRVTRDLLLFKLRSGSAQDVLPIVPGSRRVRVEVRSGGRTRTQEIAGSFRAGATRRLAVEVGRGGSVSLEWR